MKTLMTSILLSLSVSASGETIECSNPVNEKVSYRVKSSDLRYYHLTVRNSGSVSYQDILEGTDYQGALVLESKKTYMNLEYMNDVTYTYTVMRNGNYQTVSEKLNCEVL